MSNINDIADGWPSVGPYTSQYDAEEQAYRIQVLMDIQAEVDHNNRKLCRAGVEGYLGEIIPESDRQHLYHQD